MKLAILSDIHGNAEALRAALTDAKKADVEHLLILGDLVGYYYDIRGVLEQIAGWPQTVIGGNHEDMLGNARSDTAQAMAFREKYGSALDIALTVLSSAEIDWLAGLPSRAIITVDGVTFELCHGAPDDRNRYVYPNASEADLLACEIPGRVVLMGHTHYPLVAARRDCVLLNPGSVGQARDFGGFAAWALYDTLTRVIAPRRSPYDTAPLIAESRRLDPDLPYLRDILDRNRIGKGPA
jgi:putative phosphoesterase